MSLEWQRPFSKSGSPVFSERHHRGVVGGWVWLLGLVVFVLELFRIHCVLNVMISLLFLFFVLCEEMLS